jgi:hypothetical protein
MNAGQPGYRKSWDRAIDDDDDDDDDDPEVISASLTVRQEAWRTLQGLNCPLSLVTARRSRARAAHLHSNVDPYPLAS